MTSSSLMMPAKSYRRKQQLHFKHYRVCGDDFSGGTRTDLVRYTPTRTGRLFPFPCSPGPEQPEECYRFWLS